MKKFITRLAIFCLIVVVIDILFGYANKYAITHAQGGTTYCQQYTTHLCNEDIIMFGSSRMRHHYNPDIIEKSLGLTCYNAGEDGSGIIMNYAFFKMLTKRYKPKMIIYDLYNFDMYRDDNSKYLGWLRKYYDDTDVAEVINSVSSSEKIKCISNLYRYNTRCIAAFADYIHPIRSYNKGYSPIEGTMSYIPEATMPKERELDSLKLYYVEKLIDDCRTNGINIYFVSSPKFRTKNDTIFYEGISKLLEKNSVDFLQYYYTEEISEDPGLFKDKEHLNSKGADIFTNILVDRIKTIIDE